MFYTVTNVLSPKSDTVAADIWNECIKISALNLVENKQIFCQIEVIFLLKICLLALIRFINMIEKMSVLVHSSVLKWEAPPASAAGHACIRYLRPPLVGTCCYFVTNCITHSTSLQPNDQTVVASCGVAELLETLKSVTKIPGKTIFIFLENMRPYLIKYNSGIGRRTGELLSSVGIESLAQLRNASVEELVGAGITK